jgi:predicted ATPase
MATQGYASPEAGHTYARARALAQQVEETPQLAQVVFGLWVFYHARAEHAIGRELSEQFLSLARRVQDPALLLVGHQMVGQSLFCLGELVRARRLFEQALTYDDPPERRALALLYVTDPVVASHAWLSFTLSLLGYPDQAQRHNRAALTLAHELGHALTLGSALAWAAFFHRLRGDVQATYEQAEAAVRLATDQGLPFRVAMGTILRGWAMAALGEGKEGRAQLRQGLDGWRATGAAISWSYYLGSLADAYTRGAQGAEGLATVAEALTCVEQTGERYAEAELHRLRGELLLKPPLPDAPQAAACFQQALAIARRQEAKSLELRAAMSLARLWQSQGKRDEARMLLASIYGWFTEGFDTADLQEAKALLAQLS